MISSSFVVCGGFDVLEQIRTQVIRTVEVSGYDREQTPASLTGVRLHRFVAGGLLHQLTVHLVPDLEMFVTVHQDIIHTVHLGLVGVQFEVAHVGHDGTEAFERDFVEATMRMLEQWLRERCTAVFDQIAELLPGPVFVAIFAAFLFVLFGSQRFDHFHLVTGLSVHLAGGLLNEFVSVLIGQTGERECFISSCARQKSLEHKQKYLRSKRSEKERER